MVGAPMLGRPHLQIKYLKPLHCICFAYAVRGAPDYCRAVRTLAGTAPGWLVRQGLMSSPPRRV